MKIYVVPNEDDHESIPIDVTEAVQVTYDCLLASMDFSSGFLGVEELTALADLAKAAGFGDIEDVYREIKRAEAEAERQQQLTALRKRETLVPGKDVARYRAMIEQQQAAIYEAAGRMFDKSKLHGEIVVEATESKGDTP